MKAKDFDQPIVFLLVVTMGVVALIALIAWGASALGWTGLLGLVKGGATK